MLSRETQRTRVAAVLERATPGDRHCLRATPFVIHPQVIHRWEAIMVNGIDHVVIVVRDLAQASADYARAGFTVTPGGEHADGASHNALIPFADGGYLELFAFKEPNGPSMFQQWRPRLDLGEGPVHYALRSDDVAADVARLRAAGFAISDPHEGGRIRSNGQELRWRSAWFDGDFALPFLIEDVTPRELRVPGGAAAVHPLGARGIAGLRVLADDPNSVAAPLATLFRAPRPSVTRVDHAAPDVGIVLALDIGAQRIDLLHPGDVPGEMAAALARFGPGPYEVALAGDTSATGALVGDLHGARIMVAG
jgi:catechol 2,3-dioxygenase-like lactoylglutathione lyase family enzyme